MKKHIKTLLVVATIATGPVLQADCFSAYNGCVAYADEVCAGTEEPWECRQVEYEGCYIDFLECINNG